MKGRLLVKMMAGLGLVLGTTSTFNQPSLAQGTKFLCGDSKGVPVTYASTPRGKIPVIRWNSNYFNNYGWTPRRRCVEVSKRFQRNYENGMLKSITTGTLRGKPVVCAAVNQDSRCTDKTLLFTLKPGSDANLTVRRLLAGNTGSLTPILNESACNESCPIYINMEQYLGNADIDENISPSAEASGSNSQADSQPWWDAN